MNSIYKSIKVLSIILLCCHLNALAQSTTFAYSGTTATYTVPNGVTYVVVDAEGAEGGSFGGYYYYGGSPGGLGGKVTCSLTVTPGQILYVNVGGQGNSGTYGFTPGGFNGGGNSNWFGGSGGGASDIRTGGTALTDRVIVAGGGGGGGQDCFSEKGGDGGGLTAENGWDSGTPYAPAAGGNQVTGYVIQGLGEDGLFYSTAGAGGGGFWGGLAGNTVGLCSSETGGGGGSSFDGPGTTAAVHTPGTRSGNGTVTICAPAVAGVIIADTVCVGSNTTFIDTTSTKVGTVSWSSSNPGIATVDPVTGVVTGVGAGTVTISRMITTPCGSATANITITVHPVPAPITGPTSVCVGNIITLSDATPGGAWTSTVPTNATINTSGDVTGVNAGTTIISYTLSTGCATKTTVAVIALPAPIVGPADACVGYTTLYTDASPFGTWSSSSPANATIDPVTGLLTGVGPGTTQIFYTVTGGCFQSKFVTIHNPAGPIVGTSSICQGNSTALTIFGFGGAWSSSNPSISTVDPTGLVTGIGGGIDTILYTVLGCPPAEFPMVVNTITPILGSTSLCRGVALSLSDATTGGSWSSSDTNIATVSPTGVVTNVSSVLDTTATITYTIPSGCLVTHPIIVKDPPAGITGADSVCQGASTILADATPGGTWSSTDLAIAQIVDITGVLTGISTGTVNISYTLTNGCFATKSFFVEPPMMPLTGITRTPPEDRLCAFTTVKFHMNPTYGGPAPLYKWSRFGVALGDSVSDTFFYTPIHGDVIVVTMLVSGVCTISDTVRDSVTFDIDSNRSPIINITNSTFPDTIHYLGQVVRFFSVVNYGGDAPTYQWYKNGSPIGGATESTYETAVYAQDTFYCKVSSNAPCLTIPHDAISNKIIIYERVGTNSISNASNTLTLFPNPSNGNLVLSGTVSATSKNDIAIEISDMLGRTIYSSKAAPKNGVLNEQITLENVTNGTYLLRVNSATGNDVFHFVVNK